MPSSFMGPRFHGTAPERGLSRNDRSAPRPWATTRFEGDRDSPRSGTVPEVRLGGLGEVDLLARERAVHLGERRRLELADALARQAQLLADRLARPRLPLAQTP